MQKMNKVRSKFRRGESMGRCIACLGLEERLRAQSNSNTNKPITTRATTSTTKSSRHAFKDEKVESHTDKNGICYRIGGRNKTSFCFDCLYFPAFQITCISKPINKLNLIL